MSKLTIIYNKEFDTQRVIYTIKKIDWYTENKYDYRNFSFPKTLDKEKLKEYSEEEIRTAVEAEYSDDVYKENESFLLDNLEKVSKEIDCSFLKSNLLYQDEYRIFLTKYGIGGSYDLPNIVIINLNKTFRINILKTIIHEIIHLAIQEYIDEYKLDQWQKERIVDLFFVKNFPRRALTQNVYISMNTEELDQTFDGNFPDMKAIIEKFSK